jgi:ABC-type nitrate/sulfonate/bicarbonate transport system substrate-binding protein
VSSILSLIIKRKNLSISPQPVSFDFSYFVSNENCVYPVYLNEEPVRARILNNINIVEIDPLKEENGGIKLYGNVIVCHKDKFDSCKDQVDKIIDGLSKGWVYAQQNEDETAQIVNKYVKNDMAYVKEVVKRTVSFATNLYGNQVPAGHMDIGAWQNTYNTLKEAGLLSKDFDLKTAIYIK